MVIGNVGCLISIGIFTDDENDLINSSLRFICFVGVDGDKLRFREPIGECFIGRKSINDNVFGF